MRTKLAAFVLSLLAVAASTWLGNCQPAVAAVAVAATGTEQLSSTGLTTYNYTGLTVPTSVSNGALIVLVSAGPTSGGTAPTAITATWNGTAIPSVTGANDENVTAISVWIGGLINPASGNNTLAINWTTSGQVAVIAIALSGVNQTGGTTSFANGVNASTSPTGATTVSNVVTSAVNNMVFGTWAQSGSGSFSSLNQTQLYVDNGGALMDDGANSAAGASSVTLTGTFSVSGISVLFAGVNVVAAAGSSCILSLALLNVGC